MDYEYFTTCALCGEKFTVCWLRDPGRVGPGSIVRITCPICGQRYNRTEREIIPFRDVGRTLPAGRPIRTVEVVFDCPTCHNEAICASVMHTDLTWEELASETTLLGVCLNAACPQRGVQHVLNPARLRLGALNPSQGSVTSRMA